MSGNRWCGRAEPLNNPRGISAGVWIEDGEHMMRCFPGRRGSWSRCFTKKCCRGGGAAGVSQGEVSSRITRDGARESLVDSRIQPVYQTI